MPNIIGTTINKRYKVIESLGRGGMAEVYKVWDAQRQEHLAAKVLREDLAYDVVFLKRFEREARTLAKLQHPNIVRFYGLEKDNDLVLMLMDYIEGESLRKTIYRARGKGINEKETLEIIQPIATALHYAHQQGVVHCDLKPGNILIDKTGKVYISDFGIARHIDAATMTLVGAGSPAYMAPELVRGREPTPQSDIYSLGIVLYEMLTGGERPFTGDKATITGSTAEKVRWEQVHLEPELPITHNKKISKEIEAVVLRCLEKDPQKRFGSSMDLLKALRHPVVGGEAKKNAQPTRAAKRSTQPTQKKAGKSETPLWRRWYLWAGLVAAAVALLLTQITPPPLEIPAPPTDTPPATAVPTLTAVPTQTLIPTFTPVPTLGIGSEMVSKIDGMTMVYVPKGEFLRGSTKNDPYADSDEFPQRSITLDAFWIDQTEVTTAMFAAFLNDKGNQKEGGENWMNLASGGDIWKDNNIWQVNIRYVDYPARQVTWFGANAYCQWAGRGLPTEAEWEKAARGDDGRTYPWGEDISCSQATYSGCSEFGVYSPVGYYGDVGASPYGALDMAGNVREWVRDWYDEYYYYNDRSHQDNSFNTIESGRKILRGGSWYDDEQFARSANRYDSPPFNTNLTFGFRCALNAESP